MTREKVSEAKERRKALRKSKRERRREETHSSNFMMSSLKVPLLAWWTERERRSG